MIYKRVNEKISNKNVYKFLYKLFTSIDYENTTYFNYYQKFANH